MADPYWYPRRTPQEWNRVRDRMLQGDGDNLEDHWARCVVCGLCDYRGASITKITPRCELCGGRRDEAEAKQLYSGPPEFTPNVEQMILDYPCSCEGLPLAGSYKDKCVTCRRTHPQYEPRLHAYRKIFYTNNRLHVGMEERMEDVADMLKTYRLPKELLTEHMYIKAFTYFDMDLVTKHYTEHDDKCCRPAVKLVRFIAACKYFIEYCVCDTANNQDFLDRSRLTPMDFTGALALTKSPDNMPWMAHKKRMALFSGMVRFLLYVKRFKERYYDPNRGSYMEHGAEKHRDTFRSTCP